MTYKKLLEERTDMKLWIAREESTILDLNREISKHLEWIDTYKGHLKQVQKDILRYETEQELKEKGIIE